MNTTGSTRSSSAYFLTFCLGPTEYAIDALSVNQVFVPLPLTRLPHAPDYILGVVTHRGQVIPAIDMRLRLGMTSCEPSRDTSMVAVRAKGLSASLVVDRVTGFLTIALQDIVFHGVGADVPSPVVGIALPGKTPKIVLDLERLLVTPASVVTRHG